MKDVALNGDAGARRRLVEAALKLFDRRGYGPTSVREIVEEAGYTKPVLYYHFGNKEGLYAALLDEALAELRARLDVAARQPGTARERIVALSRELFCVGHENVEVVRLIHSAYYGPPQGAPPCDCDAFHHAFFEPLVELVREGMERGELREGDPELVALALHGAATTALEGSLAHPEEGFDESLVEKLLDLMFQGIAVSSGCDGEQGQ